MAALAAQAAASHLSTSFSSSISQCSQLKARNVLPRNQRNAALVVRSEERKFTGYVEKDSAGQTNIYSVEPDVYVSKSAFSTNARGTEEGSGGVVLVSGLLALAAVAGAATVLLSVDRFNPAADVIQPYSGPPLSYYVYKFKNPSAVPESFIDASQQEAPELPPPPPVSAVEEIIE